MDNYESILENIKKMIYKHIRRIPIDIAHNNEKLDNLVKYGLNNVKIIFDTTIEYGELRLFEYRIEYIVCDDGLNYSGDELLRIKENIMNELENIPVYIFTEFDRLVSIKAETFQLNLKYDVYSHSLEYHIENQNLIPRSQNNSAI